MPLVWESLSQEDIKTARRNDQRKLNQMIGYCKTETCLRSYFLNYFGERRKEDCGKCSNCKKDPELIGLRLPVIESQKPKRAKNFYLGLSDDQKYLFQRLKKLRIELAAGDHVPPFIICGDKTLIDLCIQVPTCLADLSSIYGFGEKKIKKYGNEFLFFFQSYLDENHLSPEELSSEKIKLKTPRIQNKKKVDLGACNATELASIINDSHREHLVSAVKINKILLKHGYLMNESYGKKSRKRVTSKGLKAGIIERGYRRRGGRIAYSILHGDQSKKLILALLKEENIL